jgi:hypothetical protein
MPEWRYWQAIAIKPNNWQHWVIVLLWPATKMHKILKIVSIVSFVSCILELWNCTRGRVICVIWVLRTGVNEVCTLPGLYATQIGNLLPTFRGNLSTPSSGVKEFLDYSIVSGYRSLHKTPEERKPRRVGMYTMSFRYCSYINTYIHVLACGLQSCVALCAISSVKTCWSDLLTECADKGIILRTGSRKWKISE